MLIIPPITNINSINNFIEFYRNLHNEAPAEIISLEGNTTGTKIFLLHILFALKLLPQYGEFKIKVQKFKNVLEIDLINLVKMNFLEYSLEYNYYTFKNYKGICNIHIDKLSLLFARYNNKYTPNKKLNL